jgi:hypothetical protein
MTPAAVALAQDAEDLSKEVASGSWIDPAFPAAGGSLDQLGPVDNPLDPILQSGVPWLIDQIRPLNHALDSVTGDPAQIETYIRTWRAVATTVSGEADTLGRAAGRTRDDWQGRAGNAHHAYRTEEHAALSGLADAASTHADIALGSGQVVARARTAVRGHLADFVQEFQEQLPKVLSENGVTTVAMPILPVVVFVVGLVARFAGIIYRLLQLLIQCLSRLRPLLSRLGRLFGRIRNFLRRLGRREDKEKEREQLPSPKESPHAPEGGGEATDKPRELTTEEKFRQHEEQQRDAQGQNSPQRQWPEEEKPLTDAEKEAQMREAEERQRIEELRDIEHNATYDDPRNAVGGGDKQLEQIGSDPMENQEFRDAGYTEKQYWMDKNSPDRTQYSIPYNPTTRMWRRGNLSSSNR